MVRLPLDKTPVYWFQVLLLPMLRMRPLMFKLREPVKPPSVLFIFQVIVPASAAFMSSVLYCRARALLTWKGP